MYLVPSLLVYLAVVLGVGNAAATAAGCCCCCCRLLLGGMTRNEGSQRRAARSHVGEREMGTKTIGGKTECDVLSDKERNQHWRGLQAREPPPQESRNSAQGKGAGRVRLCLVRVKAAMVVIGGPSQSRRGKSVVGCCYSEIEPQVSRRCLLLGAGLPAGRIEGGETSRALRDAKIDYNRDQAYAVSLLCYHVLCCYVRSEEVLMWSASSQRRSVDWVGVVVVMGTSCLPLSLHLAICT